MREIKFRGKRLNTGEWIKGYYFVNRGRHYIAPDEFVNPLAEPRDYEVAPDTIGQYTGLNDIEGNEIYEGDIISSGATTGIVMYDCEQAGFIVQKEKAIELRFYSLLGIKVISNIHDNPELLER